jgi:hypothetical protein
MHLSRTILVAFAAYAIGAAAHPRHHEAPNPRAPRLGKRYVNTSSTTGTSLSASQSQTTVSLEFTTTSGATTSMESTASSESLQTSIPTSTIFLTVSSTKAMPTIPSTMPSSDSLQTSVPTTSAASSTSASASAAATTQAFTVSGGTYTAVGCYIDVANVGFPLIGAIKVAGMSTAPQCLNTCADPAIGGPYVYAGVEGTECFCSNNFASDAPQSPGACTSGLKKRDGLEKRAGGSIIIYKVSKTQRILMKMLTMIESLTRLFYQQFQVQTHLLLLKIPLPPRPMRVPQARRHHLLRHKCLQA